MRVASAPHGHVYIQHLTDPDRADGVFRLPDPTPERSVPGAPWWPLVMLNEEWITTHAHEFDVFHLHFGFDALEPAELRRIVGALRANDKPLIYTVHDLRNPHQTDPSIHRRALDVLIPAASQLITLTTGAAERIAQGWGRTATVVPHPHVVPLELMERPRPEHDRPRVGLHLKSMRTNMNPLPVLRVLLTETARRDMTLVIDAHTDVVTRGGAHYNSEVAELLEDVHEYPRVEVHVHDFYTDEQLWDYILGLDLSVLAYRFGTHSGWLEACYDLGTRVLAPSVGWYHQQHPGVLSFDWDENDRPVQRDIAAALDSMATAGPWRAGRQEREAQRREIARVHAEIYRTAMAEVTP